MKILFRIDASSKAGLGHLRRMSALAMALARCEHACFFLVDDAGEKRAWQLPCPQIQSGVEHAPWDVLIVDSYHIQPQEYERLHALARYHVVVCDGKDYGWACEAIMDHNLYANEAMYAHRRNGKTALWVGPQYAMMHEEILRGRSRFVVRNECQTLLLTLGGGSNPEATLHWLDCIGKLRKDIEIMLLTSTPIPAPHGMRCRVICAPPDVGAVMTQADIALSAAGVTSLELACIGVPAMHVILADNQDLGAQAAEKEGIAICLGGPQEWTADKFLQACQALRSPHTRRQMSQKGRMLVDGMGPQRLVRALEKLSAGF